MTLTTRLLISLALSAILTCDILGAQTVADADSPAPATTSEVSADSESTTTADAVTAGAENDQPTDRAVSNYDVRVEFGNLLRQHPSSLRTVLAADPTLLGNREFLARYPEVQSYVDEHPSILANPAYYTADFVPYREPEAIEKVVEMLAILGSIAIAAFAFIWLVRAFIEQRRWNRLSRQQTEVHNKILDRFGTSAELLEYVKSPAGSRYLESAPIPLHAEPAPQANASTRRLMLSIQIGVVVVAAALGLALASIPFDGESSQGFFALGIIAFCIGGGFIASAIVSISLSKKLGLWDERNSPEERARLDESRIV